MKKLINVLALALAGIAGEAALNQPFVQPANAQTALTETTLSAAVSTTSGKVIQVASASGIAAPSLTTGLSYQIYIDTELMDVESVSGTLITVRRGAGGTRAQTHASGTTVYAGVPNQAFFQYPQWGTCTASAQLVLPIIDYVDQYIENCVTSPITGVGQWNLVVQGTVNFPQPVQLSSDYSNATTTFSNVFSAGIPVHAGLPYTVRCDIIWQGSATTAGPKYQFTGPTSPTKVVASATSQVTSTTLTQAVATAFSSSMANTGTITASTLFHDIVTLGLINGANSGTLQLQAAANGTGTLTIKAGSYCIQQ
jgi:hypothetical protein